MTDSRPRFTPQLSDGSGASFGKSDGGAGKLAGMDLALATRLFLFLKWNTQRIADHLGRTEAEVYNALAKVPFRGGIQW